MSNTPEWIAATALEQRHADSTLAALKACDTVVMRVRDTDSATCGRIVHAAETARSALFDLLNTAHSYGQCGPAGRALDEVIGRGVRNGR